MHHFSDPAVTTFRHSRWASGFYLVAGTLNCCFAIAFLILALADAAEHTAWRYKVWAVTGSALAAISLALWGFELFLSGRAMARTWVKVGEHGVSLRMPIPDGDLTWVGPEIHLAWDTIDNVTLREKTCTIDASGKLYKLDARNCSDPRKLAELVAAKKGISLTSALTPP
jgi:hypothetical protein